MSCLHPTVQISRMICIDILLTNIPQSCYSGKFQTFLRWSQDESPAAFSTLTAWSEYEVVFTASEENPGLRILLQQWRKRGTVYFPLPEGRGRKSNLSFPAYVQLPTMWCKQRHCPYHQILQIVLQKVKSYILRLQHTTVRTSHDNFTIYL